MFKRFKSLAMIIAIFGLLVGGGQFMSQAAANEAGESFQDKETTYQVNTDNMFYEFYNRLLQNWNNHNEVRFPNENNEQKQDANNKTEEDAVTKEPQEKEEEAITEPKPKEEPQVEQAKPIEPAPEQKQEEKQDQLNSFEREMFELTNKERVNNGLQPLEVEYEVSRVAREKSRDMATNRYFDHNSPVYGSPFDMMKAYGITYRTAGENIAMGQRTPNEVVQAWMNSPGHRANILNPNFTHLGVGYVENGNYWTQQFIGK